jgi:acyl CoA:acetate/3-ketoacid CoA transferase alpha subunit
MMPFPRVPYFVPWDGSCFLSWRAHAAGASGAGATAARRDSQMSVEALLMELNPRGGAAIVKAWHGDDPETLAAFYTEDAVFIDERGCTAAGRKF